MKNMIVIKEYNFDLITGELISISNKSLPFTVVNDKEIIFNKRKYGTGSFIERYIPISNTEFASVDKDFNITNTYKRETGVYDYGCNVKYTRDDGRIYYAQNKQINIDLLPYNEKIKECLQRCPIDETMELNEVIFVEKQSGPQVYFIFCPIASIHNEGEL